MVVGEGDPGCVLESVCGRIQRVYGRAGSRVDLGNRPLEGGDPDVNAVEGDILRIAVRVDCPDQRAIRDVDLGDKAAAVVGYPQVLPVERDASRADEFE